MLFIQDDIREQALADLRNGGKPSRLATWMGWSTSFINAFKQSEALQKGLSQWPK